MAEQLDLTTPVTLPSLTFWKVIRLVLDRELREISITLRGTNNELLFHQYTGTLATTLLNQLNTANMSTQSLERRVLLRLVADGVLSGTISGSPD